MLEEIINQLARIESKLEEIASERAQKEFYTTAEVAELVGRAEFTVREWCRMNRVDAIKHSNGAGRKREWRIAHEELQRILNHGPRPLSLRR